MFGTDQSASTYPASEPCSRPRWRSAQPGPHNQTGLVWADSRLQVSELPVDCQAILLPPPANIVGRSAPSRAPVSQSSISRPRRVGVESLTSTKDRPGDPRQLVGQGHNSSVNQKP